MKNSLTAHKLTVDIADQRVCQAFDFTLQAGDICGILGPNGAGKTTLLHTFANLHPVTHGEIYLNHQALTAQKPKAIAKQLGILFQDMSVSFSQTVLEFCLTGRHPHLSPLAAESPQDKHIAIAALTLLELDQKLLQKVHTLSGGEQRRLAIATLLTQAPSIYLLDEPTNHLDIRHQMLVLNHFKHLAKTTSATVILSLHDINLAQYFCNRIVLLFGNGHSVHGTPEALLTAENLSRLYQYPLQNHVVGSHQFWLPIMKTPFSE